MIEVITTMTDEEIIDWANANLERVRELEAKIERLLERLQGEKISMSDEKVTLTLPIPMSDNRYYGKPKGARHKYVTKGGRAFKHDVAVIVANENLRGHFGNARLAMLVELHLPSGGDIQNRLKCLCDALEESHIFNNDRQIDDLRIIRRHRVEGGRCQVTLWRL